MVRQGDTVTVLARRFGVPEKEILKANGLKSASQVEPGQRLVIPTFGTAGSAASGCIGFDRRRGGRQEASVSAADRSARGGDPPRPVPIA
ncbi:LysM peptidoglycan-binding domain-containing protein [Sinorhizobium meliloti]|nr:LysM peptidoglycan-binding domain-containing protein [Sinorhizobium meliloti]